MVFSWETPMAELGTITAFFVGKRAHQNIIYFSVIFQIRAIHYVFWIVGLFQRYLGLECEDLSRFRMQTMIDVLCPIQNETCLKQDHWSTTILWVRPEINFRSSNMSPEFDVQKYMNGCMLNYYKSRSGNKPIIFQNLYVTSPETI